MLVLRLGEGDHRRLGLDGLTVTDDRVRDLEGNLGVVLLEILEDDLEVKLTGTGNNVLTGLGNPAWTQGSDLERRLRPSTSLGKSLAFLTSTATCTTARRRTS